jgi:hypothetical protein
MKIIMMMIFYVFLEMGPHCVAQVSLELLVPPASASQVLELQVVYHYALLCLLFLQNKY